MIIAVASGKGGTGKTTMAVNMAMALGVGVDLLDCDVEEPNAHLFLQPDIKSSTQVDTPIPEIDEFRCTLCRKCAELCRFNALAVVGERVLVFPELCHGCGGCMVICPEKAVAEASRPLGTLHFGRRGDIGFIGGELRVGEAMCPPLIRAVRNRTDPKRITIIDAPPGTSCPMVTAVNGSDFVLLVTEPTPFGLHDLTLAVETVGQLGIPAGLVINRADIGDDRVVSYAEKKGLPILMTIPFDRRIAELSSRGQTLIEESPGWCKRFTDLCQEIITMTRRSKATSCVNL